MRRFARPVGLAVVVSMSAGLLAIAPSTATAVTALDPTYGVDGVGTFVDPTSTPEDPDHLLGILDTVDPLGRVITYAAAGPTGDALLRLTANGQPDLTFGDGGLQTLPSGSGWTVMAATEDGIALGGSVQRGAVQVPIVLRLGPDGGADPRFGTDGYLELPPPPSGADTLVMGIDIGPEGQLLFSVGVDFDEVAEAYAVHAYRLDGGPATTFGGDGVVRLSDPNGDVWRSVGLYIDPTGRILLTEWEPSARVVRLLPDGTRDPAFGTGGTAWLGDGYAIAIDVSARDRSIFVAGGAGGPALEDRDTRVWKLAPNGALDATFDEDGLVLLPGGLLAWDVVALPSGHVAVSAENASQVRTISVLRPDGALEPAFGDGGVVHARHWYPADGIGEGAGGRLLVVDTNTEPAPDEPYTTHVHAYLLDLPTVAPTITGVTARDGGLSVTWDPTEVQVGGPVRTYHLVALDGDVVVAQGTLAGDVRQASLTGLTNGRSYQVVVHPYADAGAGVSSLAVQGIPSAGAPAGPSSAARQLTEVTGHRFATVAWAPPLDDGGSPVQGYSVITVQSSTGAVIRWRNVAPDVRNASMSDLTPGTYAVYVLPYTAVGFGAVAPAVLATAVDEPTRPPLTPTLSWVTSARIGPYAAIAWGAPVERGEELLGLHVLVVRDGVLTSWLQPRVDTRWVAIPMETSTTVEIYVFAHSKSGFGPPGDPLTFTG